MNAKIMLTNSLTSRFAQTDYNCVFIVVNEKKEKNRYMKLVGIHA